MNLHLQGKNILVTGGAKGIGRSIALGAASEGANIALHYLSSREEAEKTAEEITKSGVHVQLIQGNLAYPEDVLSMKEHLDHQFGQIDAIVNNAGWVQTKSFFQYEVGEWKKEVDICFYSVLHLVHTFMPNMIQNNQGKFINIIGDSARTGDRNLIVSAAARGGTISFLKSLALEVGKHNIQCNTVSLGLIDQGDLPFNEAMMNKIVKQYPLKRLGKTEDVVGTILFLLSQSADWITGQVLSVNGGHSMNG